MATVEEGGHKSKAKIASLEVERTSLLLELEVSKGEVSSLHARVGKDKEAMEKDYQKALELIFAYGYGCCKFKHSIYEDRPEILNDMSDSTNPLHSEFFCQSEVPPLP